MKAERKELIYRDGKCRICGENDLSKLTIHHIFPKRTKGRNLKINKTILCEKCHRLINHFWNKQVG